MQRQLLPKEQGLGSALMLRRDVGKKYKSAR